MFNCIFLQIGDREVAQRCQDLRPPPLHRRHQLARPFGNQVKRERHDKLLENLHQASLPSNAVLLKLFSHGKKCDIISMVSILTT